MNRQDVQDWLDKWPRDEMPVEVRRDGCGNVYLVACGRPWQDEDRMVYTVELTEIPLIIGAYPDKVEV